MRDNRQKLEQERLRPDINKNFFIVRTARHKQDAQRVSVVSVLKVLRSNWIHS